MTIARWPKRLATIVLLGAAHAAPAAENGQSHFAVGAQSAYAAFLPPPGETYFYGYSLLIRADSLRDGAGERVPGVEAEVLAFAPRLVHTWERPWAGFKLSSGVLALGVRAEIEAGGLKDDATGVGLVGLEPLNLTRSFGPHWHVLTGTILYFGVGHYDPEALVTYGLNYDAVAWQGSVTWTPTPDWEASLNYAAEFKQENKDSDYRSGDQGYLTFGAGHRPFADKRWDLGFSGYFVDQYEDDRQHGASVGDGNRTRRFGIGPRLMFNPAPGVAVLFQRHHESNVRNALRGDLFWLEFAVPI